MVTEERKWEGKKEKEEVGKGKQIEKFLPGFH
jgi:hypothetical protein